MKIDCFASTVDIILMMDDLNIIRNQAEMVLPWRKPKWWCLTTTTPPNSFISNMEFKCCSYFKHLGEIISFNSSEMEVLIFHMHGNNFHFCKSTYLLKSISWQAKFHHYTTINCPGSMPLNAWFSSTIVRQRIEKILKKEMKFLKKILDPHQNSNCECQL